MVQRALSDKTYILSGLLSTLILHRQRFFSERVDLNTAKSGLITFLVYTSYRVHLGYFTQIHYIRQWI